MTDGTQGLMDAGALGRVIHDAQHGSQQAWEELVRRHYGLIFTIAYAHVKDRDIAEDLVQEVFLRAWLQIANLRNPESLPHWLSRMARHLGSTWARNSQRRSELVPLIHAKDGQMEAVADEKATPTEAAMENEQWEHLEAGMMELPDQEREATLLHFVEGLPKSLIAKQMGVHPATIGRLIDRATSRLKLQLGEDTPLVAKSLELPKKGPEATIACLTAVAALSPVAQQSLAAAAAKGLPTVVSIHTSQSAGTLSLGYLALLWESITSTLQGFLLMGKMKSIATVALTTLAITAGTVAVLNQADKGGSLPSTPSTSIVSQVMDENIWPVQSPYNQVGLTWQCTQKTESEINGQWQHHMQFDATYRIVSTDNNSNCTISMTVDDIQLNPNWQGSPELVIGRSFLIGRLANGNIISIESGDGQPITPQQDIFILMGLSGSSLGPMGNMDPMQLGDSMKESWDLEAPSKTRGYVRGKLELEFAEIQDRNGTPSAVFQMNSDTTIGGNVIVSRDERTRVDIVLGSQRNVGTGDWVFDLTNPLRSVFTNLATASEEKIQMLIYVPGQAQPVARDIPVPPGARSRTTVTFQPV